MARYFSYPEINLSCPLPFEGYINFGVIGLIVFAVLIGILFSSLDEYHWKVSTSSEVMSAYYPFFLGFSFFAMRGDLMSSFSYTVMFIAAGLVLLLKCWILERWIPYPVIKFVARLKLYKRQKILPMFLALNTTQ